MAKISTYDFSVKQGNTGSLENPAGLVVRLKADATTPRDLTGVEVVFFAHWAGQTQLRMTSADAGIWVDPALGEITVPIAPDTFRDVQTRETVLYELELREAGGFLKPN